MTWGVVFTVLAAAYLVVVGLCLWLEKVLVDCRRETTRLRAELNQQHRSRNTGEVTTSTTGFTTYAYTADGPVACTDTTNVSWPSPTTCDHCGKPINGPWWVYQSGDYCDINCCLADGGTP